LKVDSKKGAKKAFVSAKKAFVSAHLIRKHDGVLAYTQV
jgi:hypothetical protein